PAQLAIMFVPRTSLIVPYVLVSKVGRGTSWPEAPQQRNQLIRNQIKRIEHLAIFVSARAKALQYTAKIHLPKANILKLPSYRKHARRLASSPRRLFEVPPITQGSTRDFRL